MASWGIAALVDEPGVLVAAFVTHHLELGAGAVHVCLDRPNEEARDLLAGVPGAHLHAAGEDGWAFQGLGKRPRTHLARQKYHASRMLAGTRLDWMMHCDADEFVEPPATGTVAALLDGAPAEANWLQMRVAERVWIGADPGADIFAGAFRLPWEEFARRGRRIYDEAAMQLLHFGLCGHRMGKCCARAGRGLFIGVHHGLRSYSGDMRDPAKAALPGLGILHFDGLTELHYVLKMMRRALNEKPGRKSRHTAARQVQFHAMAEDAGQGASLHAIHAVAKTVTPTQAARLEAAGVLRHADPGIAARAARCLGRPLDLSPAAFDRALIAHEAELIARAQAAYGFRPEALTGA